MTTNMIKSNSFYQVTFSLILIGVYGAMVGEVAAAPFNTNGEIAAEPYLNIGEVEAETYHHTIGEVVAKPYYRVHEE